MLNGSHFFSEERSTRQPTETMHGRYLHLPTKGRQSLGESTSACVPYTYISHELHCSVAQAQPSTTIAPLPSGHQPSLTHLKMRQSALWLTSSEFQKRSEESGLKTLESPFSNGSIVLYKFDARSFQVCYIDYD